ncbi:hypothetical protein HZH66_001232 [Vespula vulgaris]|uniref:Uncharacterized protein n=1 Tax=Vespula vulgaris TaxID=7454 RepID=A0A834KYC7_VESVU|nr:hypothetical protein HZH66_001232 [Vespula vulgaris]
MHLSRKLEDSAATISGALRNLRQKIEVLNPTTDCHIKAIVFRLPTSEHRIGNTGVYNPRIIQDNTGIYYLPSVELVKQSTTSIDKKSSGIQLVALRPHMVQ